MTVVSIPIGGLNNRAADNKLPDGKSRNAVNVDFDDYGNIEFPRIGFSKVYTPTGDCHSWYEYSHEHGKGLFVEGSNLKRLNLDNTATTLKAIGAFKVSYCRLVDAIYWTNGIESGRYVNGGIKEWGVKTPAIQPSVTARTSGDMYAGDYRVAITWISDGEESGTFESVRVTVQSGGGIRLTNFPIAPAYVDSLAVYVSAVNGQDLYLYDEYPINTQEVAINYNIGTVNLETQFCIKAQPKRGITLHYGRIYWIEDDLIRYTEDQRYGLQRAGNFYAFEEDVTNIISVPGSLYVTTLKSVYRLITEGAGPYPIVKVKTYGVPEGAIFQDDNENMTYALTHNSFAIFTGEGIQELAVTDIAMPIFKKGATVVIEDKGCRRLISVMQQGEISKLQHSDYTAYEVARKGNGL